MLPPDASQRVTFSSMDATIASVTPRTGVIKALKAGTTTVKAVSDADPSKSATVDVTVKSPLEAPKNIKVSDITDNSATISAD